MKHCMRPHNAGAAANCGILNCYKDFLINKNTTIIRGRNNNHRASFLHQPFFIAESAEEIL